MYSSADVTSRQFEMLTCSIVVCLAHTGVQKGEVSVLGECSVVEAPLSDAASMSKQHLVMHHVQQFGCWKTFSTYSPHHRGCIHNCQFAGYNALQDTLRYCSL